MSDPGRWGDLAPRVISAAVMIAVAAVAIWAGGYVFRVFVALVALGMTWELVRMLAPGQGGLALQLAGLGGLTVLGAGLMPIWLGAVLLAVLPVTCALAMPERRAIAVAYTALIVLGSFEITELREGAGVRWLLWLILIVVTSDVAGYFAGRILGGPKFWPRISPKKTWSGTAAGWAGAAVVGAVFFAMGGATVGLILLSVLVAFAGQMGDIAESAVKRLAGVKDSSNLIPGHGGLLDRFDAMIGAAFFVLAASLVTGLPLGAL